MRWYEKLARKCMLSCLMRALKPNPFGVAQFWTIVKRPAMHDAS
jgi:hypothetical protein